MSSTATAETTPSPAAASQPAKAVPQKAADAVPTTDLPVVAPLNPQEQFDSKFRALRRQQAVLDEQQRAFRERLQKWESRGGNGGPADPEPAASEPWQSVLEEVKALRAERAQEREQSQKQASAHELDNLKRNVARILQETEDLELLRASGGANQVLDFIGQHYRDTYDDVLRTGEVLSEDQAARLVEQREAEKLKKLLATKKAQAILRELTPSEPVQGSEQSGYGAPHTLSAHMTSQTGSEREMTLEERRALARKMLTSKERYEG